MSDSVGGALATATSDGFSLTSNTETADEIISNLASETKNAEPELSESERVSKAASELGKKGGEAAAKARAEKAKEKDAKANSGSDDGSLQELADNEPAGDEQSAGHSVSPDKPLGKPRDDPKARMLEATRQAAEVKRELAAERAEKERLRQELAEARAGKPEAKPAAVDEKPKELDFDNYADFVEARARFAAKEEFGKQFETRRQEALQRHMVGTVTAKIQTSMDKHIARLDAVQKADPTFHGEANELLMALAPAWTLDDPSRPGPMNVIADEVIDSEVGPQLVLYLARHKDELQRIAALQTPREISREMAKLEARLDAVTTATSSKPEVSKAKPPVRPVTGSPTAASVELDDDTSVEDHIRIMNARDKAKRRA